MPIGKLLPMFSFGICIGLGRCFSLSGTYLVNSATFAACPREGRRTRTRQDLASRLLIPGCSEQLTSSRSLYVSQGCGWACAGNSTRAHHIFKCGASRHSRRIGVLCDDRGMAWDVRETGAVATITRRAADRLRAGHLWVYRSDVERTGPMPADRRDG